MTDLAFIDGIARLATGCLFMAAGALLIARSLKVRRTRLEQRLALARPAHAVLVERASSSESAAEGARALGSRPRSAELREIARWLARLGTPANRAAMVFLEFRLALAACAGGLAMVASFRLLPAAYPALAILLALAGALVAWLAPAFLLARAVRARAVAAAEGLPDALELLVVCVEAGLSLEDGIARCVAELRHARPALAEELALTAADLKILPSRDQALANLAERLNVPSVRGLVTTLAQTLRYGTPLAQAMRNVATELRADSLLRIEERANELPVVLTIPMMLFIMPTIFLIVGGPAGLRVMDIFLR